MNSLYKNSVVVTGIGLVCALGDSLQDSWLRLQEGKSGIFAHQPFPEQPPRPLALIGSKPAYLPALTPRVVAAALLDAGLEPPLSDCGVVLGSSRGHQAQWEMLARKFYAGDRQEGAGAGVSPAPNVPAYGDWLDTLPHMGAISAARLVGATGPVLAPMAACATGIWALAQGAMLVEMGQCQRAIAGALEAPVTPLTMAGFAQMGALAQTGAYPFDRHRQGMVLGEGGAVFVLEPAELALRRGARIYGQILGFGLTNDACYASAPGIGGRSARAAVKQCCHRAGISLSEIDYIHAHGTGTTLNDEFEARLIAELFPQKVPVSSTKGATGHALGASGALGAAFSLMALQHQVLPPCVGLSEPAFDLDWVRVARAAEIRRALCFSFGFGGQNAVVALGKIESNS
ncbi:MAG: beta-ketoacyl-ACP synthase [Oscillatoria princeps RMCB-10]|jgi:3-oxoacyl-[acyl-carrier-protein] synthase II|nr:beta-ketoacyl-ACP synthase [Oscillatoria princeps RMCB-10]